MIKIFGSTVSETMDALRPIHLGKKKDQGTKTVAIARIIISIILVFIATFLTVNSDTKEVGTGIFGTILGYWLK